MREVTSSAHDDVDGRLREVRALDRGEAPEPTGHLDDPHLETPETGIPRHRVEPGRYLDPGDDVRARLAEAVVDGGRTNPDTWVHAINPSYHEVERNTPAAFPWEENCGECSRALADAYQGERTDVAWGEGHSPGGEYEEMWEWAGTRPAVTLESPSAAGSQEFTKTAWKLTENELSKQPVGSVAIIGVGWESPHPSLPRTGGHWFNAVVSEHGVVWVDAQSGTTGRWPPQYRGDIWSLDAIVRTPGSTWRGISFD